MALQSVSSLINEVREDVKVARERLALLRLVRHEVSADRATAKRIVGRKASHIYAYLSGSHIRVTASVTVDSFKEDKALLGMLDRALDLAEATSSHDFVTEHMAERTFNFRLPHGGHLAIEARLRGDGNATCRRVQTGTKLVEQATYEIQCS